MIANPEQQKKALIGLFAVLAVLITYRFVTADKPATAPLTYTRGAVASSSLRTGIAAPADITDPLQIFLSRRQEKFPGVSRDIFRMDNPAPARPKPVSVPVTAATATEPPPPPVKTPEQIAAEAAQAAAEAARADLGKFRFLGYVTDKESSLFLSKDGELFINKRGDTVVKSYTIKDAGKDFVILLDTATRVEVRVELSGAAK